MSESSPDRVPVDFVSTAHVWIHAPADLPPGPAPLVVTFHGYGQPAETLFRFARRAAPYAIVLSPEGPSSFYRVPRRSSSGRERIAHGWIAGEPRERHDRRNDRYLLAALDTVAERHPVDPRRTALLAFSQGVGVATHLALSHPERIQALVGLAGGLARPYRERLSCLRGKDLLWVSGTRDETYPAAYVDQLLQDFRAADLDVEHQRLDEEHELYDAAFPLVAEWLRTHLR